MRYLLLLTLIFSLPIQAQTHTWQWAKSAGDTSMEIGNKVCVDYHGNVFVTGTFSGNTFTLGNVTLTNSSTDTHDDIFIAKYDPVGNLLWAKSGGGPSTDLVYGLCCDQLGNVCIAGTFDGQASTFGNIILANTNQPFHTDIFVVKYDSLGNVLWGKDIGGMYLDYCYNICADVKGNFLVTGAFFSPTLQIDNKTLLNTSNSNFYSDIFLAKYDPSGNVLWAKSIGGSDSEDARAITTDTTGSVFIAGSFRSSSVTIGTLVLTGQGNGQDVFIAKYDISGNELWVAKAIGTPSSISAATGIATDVKGNVYLGGIFCGTTLTFSTTILSNAGNSPSSDLFFTKYNSQGHLIWAKREGGSNSESLEDFNAGPDGQLYATGGFSDPTLILGSNTLTNNGVINIYLLSYDTSGTINWSALTGGTYIDYVGGICSDYKGGTYITGAMMSKNISFGNLTLANSDTSKSTYDFYIARLYDLTTGLVKNSKAERYKFFPNPFSQQSTLHTDHYLSNATLILENCSGQRINSVSHIFGNELNISRNGLSAGVYILRIEEKGKVINTQKLFIVDQ